MGHIINGVNSIDTEGKDAIQFLCALLCALHCV